MPTNHKRYYTVPEANRALESVRPLVLAVSQRAAELRRLRGDAETKRPAVDTLVDPRYFQELLVLYREIQDLTRQGCEIKDLRNGIVDFPARLEGREVCLCWRLGEQSIAHWHEVDAGFRGRQPIGPETPFEEPTP